MNRSVTIQRVRPDSLASWNILVPYLRKAIARSEVLDEETVAKSYSAGKLDLWVLLNGDIPFGALATEIVEWPKMKVFIIHLLGTEPHTDRLWFNELWPKVKTYASDSGCVKIVIDGRVGWLRKLGGRPRFTTEVTL